MLVTTRPAGVAGQVIPLLVTLSTSTLYELVEWAAAEVLGGDLGVAYVGAQGDVWDAQRDLAFAGAGARRAQTGPAAACARTRAGHAEQAPGSACTHPT